MFHEIFSNTTYNTSLAPLKINAKKKKGKDSWEHDFNGIHQDRYKFDALNFGLMSITK